VHKFAQSAILQYTSVLCRVSLLLHSCRTSFWYAFAKCGIFDSKLSLMGTCFVEWEWHFVKFWFASLSFLAHGLSVVRYHHALAVPPCRCHQICNSTIWPWIFARWIALLWSLISYELSCCAVTLSDFSVVFVCTSSLGGSSINNGITLYRLSVHPKAYYINPSCTQASNSLQQSMLSLQQLGCPQGSEWVSKGSACIHICIHVCLLIRGTDVHEA